jgi:hypothetical protein
MVRMNRLNPSQSQELPPNEFIRRIKCPKIASGFDWGKQQDQ